MLRLIIFIFLSLGFFASYSYAGSIVHRTNSNSDLSIDILNDKITFETNSKWWENVKDGIKNGRLFKYSIYISDNRAYPKANEFFWKVAPAKIIAENKVEIVDDSFSGTFNRQWSKSGSYMFFAVSTGPWHAQRYSIQSFGSSNWKKEIIAEIKSKLASSQNTTTSTASKNSSNSSSSNYFRITDGGTDEAICNMATDGYPNHGEQLNLQKNMYSKLKEEA